jgi:hypothetical protein
MLLEHSIKEVGPVAAENFLVALMKFVLKMIKQTRIGSIKFIDMIN